MGLPSKGEDTRGHTLSEAGLCPLLKSPLSLDNGSTQTPEANIKGEMQFGAIMA